MAKDNVIEKKLKVLLSLQKVDSKLDEFEVLKGELPMEVQDLEDELEGLKTRITNIEDDIASGNTEISQYQNTIKDAEALILKYESQQNQVKNNREYDALTKEIELQTLEIELSNKRIKDCQTDIDSKNETLESSKASIESKEGDLVAKKEELKTIIEETQKEEEVLKEKRASIEGKVEERLLKAYKKIKSNYRNGLAVVSYERNSCGGCFNKIPPQKQLEIRTRKKITICEHCGRIMVDPELTPAK
tara:strand:- start:3426 stop:4166 length:741 start_codon:yes stop_codon:yes gene_type:complete